jgi:DUF971 family protein
MNFDPAKPIPKEIILHKKSRTLELKYTEGEAFHLPFEYLRVYSPSAEVQGHGQGAAILQVGKRDVEIDIIETVGHYAIKPSFSDGHQSGIYSWGYLYELATQYATRWPAYLTALEQAGGTRDK